jgi:uncharacterized protein (TIGR02679 family)
MTDQIKKCAAHFRSQPEYHRILTLLLKKYQSYGRPAGQIILSDATEEECDAVRRLFGRRFSPPLRIKTADFETALQETKFRGVQLKDLLECYFETTIQTRHQAARESTALFQGMLNRTGEAIGSDTCQHWLNQLSQGAGEGYALLRSALRKGEPAEEALIHACRCWNYLEEHPGTPIRLAVLGAQAISDPHGLDNDTLCGKLFLHLLAAQAKQAFPSSAEDRAALYFHHGILCDSIASTVTQLGLVLTTPEGEHPAFRIFRQSGEISTLTLSNLSRLTGAESPCHRAYLVENQMVFSQLCDHAQAFCAPLICTSGQPTVAVNRLLDMLVASGTELYYSGDFDGMGLSMAAQYLARYPQNLHLWHLSPADYACCRSSVSMTAQSKAILQGITAPELSDTVSAVLQSEKDGYQELLLPTLLSDLTHPTSPAPRTPSITFP